VVTQTASGARRAHAKERLPAARHRLAGRAEEGVLLQARHATAIGPRHDARELLLGYLLSQVLDKHHPLVQLLSRRQGLLPKPAALDRPRHGLVDASPRQADAAARALESDIIELKSNTAICFENVLGVLEVLGKHAQLSHRIYDGECLELRASRQPDAATCKLVRSLGVSFVPEVLGLDHPQGERVRNFAALDPQKKFFCAHKGLSKRDAGVWE
jgi:hypothetical protein